MVPRFWNKGVRLTITPKSGPPIVINPDADKPIGQKRTQAYIDFDVRRTVYGGLSVARIQVKNLDPSFAQRILQASEVPDVYAPLVGAIDQQLTASASLQGVTIPERVSVGYGAAYIRLEAGHETTGLATIFEGSTQFMRSRNVAPETYLQIDASDGTPAQVAIANRKWPGPRTPYLEIARYLAETMGLIFEPRSLPDLFTTRTVRGKFYADGPAAKQMTRLTDPINLRWFIDYGHLRVLDLGGFLNIAPTTIDGGGVTVEPVETDIIELIKPIEGNISPGQQVNLLLPEYAGSWRADALSFRGTNATGEFAMLARLRSARLLVGG